MEFKQQCFYFHFLPSNLLFRSGFTFHLGYDAVIDIIGFKDSLIGNFSKFCKLIFQGNATINNTDVIIVFNISSDNGNPQITILDNQLVIGSIGISFLS